MKKLLAVFLVSMLVLTGCSKGGEKPETPETPATGAVKVGTGIVSGIKVSDAEGDKAGKFETNVTFATVTLKDDKIETVSIDTNQNDVQIATDGTKTFAAKPSKKEIGDKDYGMNWGEQVTTIQEYLVGKTLADLDAADIADANSTVSISIESYIEAVKLAIENAVEVENVAKVATVSSAFSDTTKDGLEINTTVSTVAVDADGKVVHAFLDEAQLKGSVEGSTVTADTELRTKAQRGDKDYGMNWSEQVKAITDFVVGKDESEISSIKEGADVSSTVSIYIGGLVSTLQAAVKAAK